MFISLFHCCSLKIKHNSHNKEQQIGINILDKKSMVPAQGTHRIDSHSVNTTESQIRSSSLIRQDAIINSTRLETDEVKKRVNGLIKKKKKRE